MAERGLTDLMSARGDGPGRTPGHVPAGAGPTESAAGFLRKDVALLSRQYRIANSDSIKFPGDFIRLFL